MRPRVSSALSLIALLLVVGGAACGSGEGQSTESSTGSGSSSGKIQPCDLLTDAQVSSVLPNHDGGSVAAGGASLVKGVESYQCSYAAKRDNDMDLLLVILTVASDQKYFDEWIKPNPSSKKEAHSIFRDVTIGDSGMLYGDADEIEVEAWKRSTLISVKLDKPGAGNQADAMIALATAVAAKIN
jgi:hypothetical protein